MDWQQAARALWGDDWIAPLSEFISVNRRTIERWRAGEGEPSGAIADGLVGVARRSGYDAAHTGKILRRLSSGETVADITDEIAAMRRSLVRVERESETIRVMRRGNWL